MILTPAFVFLSNPKTGSTTAEDILYQAAELDEQSMSNLTFLGKKILVKLGMKKTPHPQVYCTWNQKHEA